MECVPAIIRTTRGVPSGSLARFRGVRKVSLTQVKVKNLRSWRAIARDPWHAIWGHKLPNSSFYGESSKFDTHTCEENDVGSIKEMIEVTHEEYSKDPNGFEKLLIDSEKPLYEGCKKYTKLSILVKLYNLKVSERIKDGKLQHPVDSPAWKLVDFKWPDFGSEPRNLRLALSVDGVDPHGPKQSEDDIGTYLAPLIEDLKPLWKNGVECYDAYREEVFNLRSILLWTINDFPAYGTLLDIPGKSKDGLNARRDLVDLKLRPELAPISINPIGLGTRKSQDHLDTSNIGRPLSMRVPFKPEQELLHQAHRLGDKKVVRYNEDEAPIGENGAKLKSSIESATHYHVPITYTSWKIVPAQLKDKIFTTVEAAFVIDPRSRKNVLQTAGISFHQFKN
ncbi:hypothetical protein E5676_scaffold302G001850 [Cucumis melo var. makuwa]|uniref:Uncharacterized protein n=1 Tax=Cucumis melo var. makuwa TaxID=1194695 RepID=A0A5A7UEC8_CUCMM|nr:hypothetical protein E6C27_scaffold24G00930 [Cucumis melo var. makuwa]TYK12401.1 hypothetical protein E5676_scaffold302G001850 [Cucumis melo var. makuwa]